MKKKAIILAGILGLAGTVIIFWLKPFSSPEDQVTLPIVISEQRLDEMLRQLDLQEVKLVYEENRVYATLTPEALRTTKYQNELKKHGLLSRARGPHYQVQVGSAAEFHENFATTLNGLPGSESVYYYVGSSEPALPYAGSEESDSTPIDLRIIPFLFGGATFLWAAAVYVIIPVLAVYLLILGIRRLRKPSPQTLPPPNQPKENGQHRATNELRQFPLKLGERIAFITVEEIACFFAQDNHVYLYDILGKEHLVEYTLSDLENKLPSQFIRVHRSYIVNTHLIREIRKQPGSRFAIKLRDEQQKEVVTGQSYAAPVKQLFEI